MYVWCIHLWSLILMHVCMMRQILLRTDERTNEQGDSRSLMHVCLINEKHPWSWYMHVWCMYLSWYTGLRCTYVWCIYPWSLNLIHARMMHKSMFSILDPGPDTCMCDAFINVPQSLTLMHVCMMHLSMILNRACMYGACMYGACIYDAANFVTDGPTNERTRRF